MLLMYMIIISWMLIINIVTLFVFARDKKRALDNKWRISEKTLLALAFLGGYPAALIAMHRYRHKTKKLSFKLKMALAIFLSIIIFVTPYIIILINNKIIMI